MLSTEVKRLSESSFDEKEFIRFRNLIRSKSGLFFSDKKRNDLKTGVLKAFHYAGQESLDRYYSELSSGGSNSALFKTLISFMTVGETYFFRHFDVVERTVIPNLIKAHHHDRTLRIWSAGCSTGEEPYTVAMTLHNLLNKELHEWNIKIVATDININSIDYARDALYRPWSLRSINDYYKERYFTKSEGLYYLNPEIRSMVHFDYMNLVDESYPLAENFTKDLDLIFCRNVTIYFEAETTIQIINRFYNCLKDKSILAVGHAEPSSLIYDKYIAEIYPDAVIYRKDAAAKKESNYKIGIRTRRDVFEFKESNKTDSIVPSLNKLEKQIQNLGGIKFSKTDAPTPVAKPVVKVAKKKVEKIVEVDSKGERRSEWNESALFAEGLEDFGFRKFEESKKKFKEITEKNPANGRAHYMLAHIYANTDHISEAREYCKKAIEKDSLLIEAYYLLGLILKEENAFDDSIKMFKKTIYIDPDFALGYYELAVNYFKMNDTIQGQKYLVQTSRILKNKTTDERVGVLDELTVRELLMMVNMWNN